MSDPTEPDPSAPYQRFVPSLRTPLEQFASRLQHLCGSSSIGWTVFGQAVDGELPAAQRIQSVLVLETIDLEMLRKLAAFGAQFHRERFAPPLTMTPEAIRTSRDSFPLELIEIQQRHVTVLGEDVFAPLEFDVRDVRLQCERELKVMLLAMRQAVLVSGGDEAALGRLQSDAGRGLLRVLRGMLWVKGQKAFVSPAQLLNEIEGLVRRPMPGVRQAIEHGDHRGWELLRRLYADVESLGNLSDGW